MMTKRILIVDDEEGYRKVLLNSLTDSGYETKAVKNWRRLKGKDTQLYYWT